MEEKWLYEIRIIHLIVVLPVAIFPGGKGESDSRTAAIGTRSPLVSSKYLFIIQITVWYCDSFDMNE